MKREQEEINRYWSEDAGNYDRIIQDELKSFRRESWQRQILSQVEQPERPLKILDTGCGPAFFTIILSMKGHEVTAIDGAEGMLEAARRNVRAAGVEADIRRMDCHELEFPDNQFDLIVSRNVTHTLRDHVQVYREWQRVLKPGGTLLIFDAGWHLQGRPGPLRDQYLRDVKRCIELYGSDFSGNTDPEGIEEKEEYAPAKEAHLLGDLQRPDWDMGILQAIGFDRVSCDRDITEKLWDDKERLIYGTTPMFMIRAVKRG